MTDISVATTAYQVEDLSWDLSTAESPGFRQSVTLDISAFDATQHYPNGYIPSGCVIGIITATGKAGPYLAGGSGGLETAYGFLAASTKVPNTADTTIDVGAAALVAFSAVDVAALPFTTAETLGGFLDAAGRVDLPNLYFVG